MEGFLLVEVSRKFALILSAIETRLFPVFISGAFGQVFVVSEVDDSARVTISIKSINM